MRIPFILIIPGAFFQKWKYGCAVTADRPDELVFFRNVKCLIQIRFPRFIFFPPAGNRPYDQQMNTVQMPPAGSAIEFKR